MSKTIQKDKITTNFFLATFFPVCLRDDPQLGQCIIQAINSLKPKLATGDLGQGFRIPPAEPLYIPRLAYYCAAQLLV